MSESLPNIKGSSNQFDPNGGWYQFGTGGAIYSVKAGKNGKTTGDSGSNFPWEIFSFDASRNSSVYQDNAKVRPDSFSSTYLIKF